MKVKTTLLTLVASTALALTFTTTVNATPIKLMNLQLPMNKVNLSKHTTKVEQKVF